MSNHDLASYSGMEVPAPGVGIYFSSYCVPSSSLNDQSKQSKESQCRHRQRLLLMFIDFGSLKNVLLHEATII